MYLKREASIGFPAGGDFDNGLQVIAGAHRSDVDRLERLLFLKATFFVRLGFRAPLKAR